MGIETTHTISRKTAIERINFISNLVKEENYIALKENSYEEIPPLNIEIIYITDYYTNYMLASIMDKAFYRFSMFENYFVENDE
jgi:hypothetical protein